MNIFLMSSLTEFKQEFNNEILQQIQKLTELQDSYINQTQNLDPQIKSEFFAFLEARIFEIGLRIRKLSALII